MDVKGKQVAVVGRFKGVDKHWVMGFLGACGAEVQDRLKKQTDVMFAGEKAEKHVAKAAAQGCTVLDEAGLLAWIAAAPVPLAALGEPLAPAAPPEVRVGDLRFLHPGTLLSMTRVGDVYWGSGEAGGVCSVVAWGVEGEELGRLRLPGLYDGTSVFEPTALPGEVLLGPESVSDVVGWRRLRLGAKGIEVVGTIEAAAAGGAYHRVGRGGLEGLDVATSSQVIRYDWDGDERGRFASALGTSPSAVPVLGERRVAFLDSERQEIAVHRLEDGAVVRRLGGAPCAVGVWLPGERELVTAWSSRYLTELTLWDVEAGEKVKEIKTYIGPGSVMSLHLIPGTRRVIFRERGISVACVELDTGEVCWHLSDVALNAAIGWDGAAVLFGDDRRMVRLDPLSGARLDPAQLAGACRGLVATDARVVALAGKEAWSFDAATGAVCDGQRAHFLGAEVDQGEVLMGGRPEAQGMALRLVRYGVDTGIAQPLGEGGIAAAALRRDAVLVGSGYFGSPRELALWSRSGARRGPLRSGEAKHVALTADGSAAVDATDRALHVWGVQDAARRWRADTAHAKDIALLAVAPQGPRFATADASSVAVWSAEGEGVALACFAPPSAPSALCFASPDVLLVVLEEQGEVWRWEIDANVARSLGALGQPTTAAALAPSGLLWLGTAHGQLLALPLTAAPAQAAAPPEPASFLPDALAPGDAAGLEAALQAADWRSFDAARDLPRLRALLAAQEDAAGVGPLHAAWTAALREHARVSLLHVQGLEAPVVAWGLSPDGRYLAVGAWVGDDYARGSAVMIWEVEPARPVNVLSPVEGGVGWPQYPGCIQWSPDGARLGMAYSTNGVGSFLPFEPGGDPVGAAWVTDGWSRPPAFTWAPDSTRAAVGCWGMQARSIPGAVVSLQGGTVGSHGARWFSSDLPEGEEPTLQPQRELHWTEDGRLLGHNGNAQAFAVDVASGKLLYSAQVVAPVAWSPDGTRFAHCAVGLVIYDARTGLPTMELPMYMGATSLVWSPDSRRLAMIVDASDPFGVGPGVHIWADGALLASLDATPCRLPWDACDPAVWAWSPAGDAAALINADGAVEVWTVGAAPQRLHTLTPTFELDALAWGAADTLITLGRHGLAFWSAQTGALRSSTPLGLPREDQAPGPHPPPPPPGPHPLRHPKGDAAATFDLHPCFGLQGQWVCAFSTGLVYADASLDDAALDAALTWTVNHRWAWPWRWARGPRVHTLAELIQHPDAPLLPAERKRLKPPPAPKKPRAPKDPSFAPAGSLLDLLAVYLQAEAALGHAWVHARSEARRSLGALLVRDGHVAEARALLDAIPSPPDQLAALALGAMELALQGDPDAARDWLDWPRIEIPDEAADWNATDLWSALGGALWALGERDAAEDAFTHAEAGLVHEANPFEGATRLAGVWVRLGEAERAFQAMRLGPWDKRPSWRSELALLWVRFVEAGWSDALEAFADTLKPLGWRLDNWTPITGILQALRAQRRWDAALRWIDRTTGLSMSHERQHLLAAMLAAGDQPAADALLRDHPDLTPTPPPPDPHDVLHAALPDLLALKSSAQRYPYEQLVRRLALDLDSPEAAWAALQAAPTSLQRHLAWPIARAAAQRGAFPDAVRLLNLLPAKADYNERAKHAVWAAEAARGFFNL